MIPSFPKGKIRAEDFARLETFIEETEQLMFVLIRKDLVNAWPECHLNRGNIFSLAYITRFSSSIVIGYGLFQRSPWLLRS